MYRSNNYNGSRDQCWIHKWVTSVNICISHAISQWREQLSRLSVSSSYRSLPPRFVIGSRNPISIIFLLHCTTAGVAFLIKSKIRSRLNFPLRLQRACELSFQFYFICIIFFLANRLDYSWKKYSTWQIIFVLYVEI